KAWACHGSAGGSAKVVIDHLDIAETPAAGFVNKVILAALALEVDLHLGLCGLTHIHDRLAAQNSWRQGINVRHRRSPRGPRRRLASAGGSDAGSRCCGRRVSSRSIQDGPATSRTGGAAWSELLD